MRILCEGFSLEIVKLPKGFVTNWALKATIGKEEKFRTFYYKADAIKDIEEWRRYNRFGFETEFFGRHNWRPIGDHRKK